MRKPWQGCCWLWRSIRSIIGFGNIRSSSSAPSAAIKLAVVLLFTAVPALAQQAMQVWVPIGFQVLQGPWVVTPATLTTGTTLTVPSGARWALICAEGQVVRWRDDGVSPTQQVGMPLIPVTSDPTTSVLGPAQNNCISYSGALTTSSTLTPPTTPGAIQFTPVTSGGTLDVTYYR